MGDYNKAANGEQAGEPLTSEPSFRALRTHLSGHSHSHRGFSPVTHSGPTENDNRFNGFENRCRIDVKENR